jgi:hypothetical protein
MQGDEVGAGRLTQGGWSPARSGAGPPSSLVVNGNNTIAALAVCVSFTGFFLKIAPCQFCHYLKIRTVNERVYSALTRPDEARQCVKDLGETISFTNLACRFLWLGIIMT